MLKLFLQDFGGLWIAVYNELVPFRNYLLGLVVKSISCSSWEPEVGSQHAHQVT